MRITHASLILLFVARIVLGSDVAIVNAVKQKDHAAVRSLLQQRVDVNAPEGDGATALHWAAYEDDAELVDLLIAAGANVNATNDLQVTPLALASANGNAILVEKLLKAGANPNAASERGVTPLLQAARSGSAGAVGALLKSGANVNGKENDRQQTALMWAVGQKHPEVIAALLEARADVHARTRVFRQRVMIDRGPNRNNSQVTGYVKKSREIGTDMATGGSTALLFAGQLGDVDSARLLLKAGANINDAAADGNTSLVLAAFSGHSAMASFLLDAGADPNLAGAGYTALHAAVLRADLPTVKALLTHGANPDARLTRGSPVRRSGAQWALSNALVGATPLFLASLYQDIEIARTLAAAGANSAIPLEDGTTPLMAASGVEIEMENRPTEQGSGRGGARVENRMLPIVELLLGLGPDVNAANHAGDTAMHGAAANAFATVVQLLGDKGAKVDVKNKSGKTPLAMTSSEGKVDLFGLPVPEAPLSAPMKKTQEVLRKLGATN